ncbi:MAG: deoxyguanosinetriphosphate triphosphohydrolase [Acidobacteria bacterium]|nr:deoxyguanosinetriphosphate triphosphohydrolase [Acidobacteriota bacterium]
MERAQRAEDGLAAYALRAQDSRGRRFPEEEHPYRSPFQRDRDRIIHSRAFRRLEYKTQVFVNHEGDHYRTRLTHTIEVAQITRTIARALGLNVDLAETLALSHDLGHPPFGHAGEDTLNELMAGHGGFEHNLQTLRLVEKLERRYADFPGLNLTYEVREGIVKHSEKYKGYLNRPDMQEYELELPGPLEAQLIDLADEIAYNHHDLDDGLESRLLGLGELRAGVPLFGEIFSQVEQLYPRAEVKLAFNEALRRLINRLVTDLIEHSLQTLDRHGIRSAEEVRRYPEPLISFSAQVAEQNSELKAFLKQHLYRHDQILRMLEKCRKILEALFQAYSRNPGLLSPYFQRQIQVEEKERVICDYIAGMTDRYAMDEYSRLFPS